jgi:hypothetical protein
MRCEPIDAPIGARPSNGQMACVACGCTDDRACPGGCSWVSRSPPLCSACVPLEALEVETRPSLTGREALYGIEEQADLATADGVPYGADRCPASPTPALHVPIYLDDTSGYCVRCRLGFFA